MEKAPLLGWRRLRSRPIALDPILAADAYLDAISLAARRIAAARTEARHARLVFDWAAVGLVLLLILKSRVLARLGDGLAARRTPPLIAGLLIAMGFVLGVALSGLAARWIAAALWPDGGPGVDLAAGLAGLPATAIVGGLALALLLGLARAAPRWGWAWLGALSTIVIFWLLLLAPVTLTPRLRNDTPAAIDAVRAPLLAFVQRGGMRTDRLYQHAGSDPLDVDVEGLGAITHVALSRGALAAPTPQTYAALGHLLGHYRHRDLLSMALLWSACGLALFWAAWRLCGPVAHRLGEGGLAGVGDPAAAPAMGLIVWAWLALAVLAFNSFDQAINDRADAYALQLTRDPDALCRWLMATEGADKADPSVLEALLFYDHPPLKARLIQAQRWKSAHLPGYTGAF